MAQTQIIQTILRDSAYHPGLFSHDEITALGERVSTKGCSQQGNAFCSLHRS